MKTLSQKQALLKLRKLKADYRRLIRENYEHRAKNCLTCETQGVCCTDAHFVNVHITRLEAVLLGEELRQMPVERQKAIFGRIRDAVRDNDLKTDGDSFGQTYACPLFEKGTGCLVHPVKPVPCIQHACYERREHLPPDELQTSAEEKIERLDKLTYRQNPTWLPLPIWLDRLNPFDKT